MIFVCKICGQKIDDTQRNYSFIDFNICKFCAVKYKEFIEIKKLHNKDIKT